MLTTTPTTNSFNNLDPLDNRKSRVASLMEIKREAEQMAAAGADPAAVKSLIQERRKAISQEFPDEPSMRKAVNASQKYKEIAGSDFDAPAPGASGSEQMGGFNPGFGMSAPGTALRPPAPAPDPALERGIDELYQRSGFRGGPLPEGMNDPGALVRMLPHDV